MLFPNPRTPSMYLANAAAPILLGLLYALVTLNTLTECGQGGECLKLRDFHPSGMAVARSG